MTDEDKIRRALKNKLQEQRERSPISRDNLAAPKRLGSLLFDICREKGWSAHDLALKLNVEDALAEAILSGFLPRSQLDDDFLRDIGQAVGYDFDALKRVLNQDMDL